MSSKQNNQRPADFESCLVGLGVPFLTWIKRILRRRFFPAGHPRLSTGFGRNSRCQSPLKLLPLPGTTCPGLNWAVVSAKAKDCQSQYHVPTKAAVVISGNRSLHPHTVVSTSLGKVQCRRILATDTSGQSQTDAGTVAKIRRARAFNS